ncbi:MAG: hypothetical protein LUO82_01680 [Methanomicrobiales archaeon]|nr:hypothetical protein [Methanomicrobiales archaeon]
MTLWTVTSLPGLIAQLPSPSRSLIDRLFTVSVREGELDIPPGMKSGDRDFHEFERQQIVRVTNRITLESTLFNELRAQRPLDTYADPGIAIDIEKSRGGAFCHPLTQTPADRFGRVEGTYCLTAANLAKYDHLHAVLIFRDHDPYLWEEEKIRDLLDVAHHWCTLAHHQDPAARYPFIMWNCLWRAGASIIHGHAQVLLAVEPYRAVEVLHRAVAAYQMEHGSDYLEDLILAHQHMGLTERCGDATILAYLTPIKEKEVMIISRSMECLPPAITRALSTYHHLGVQSFNLAILMPPLGSTGHLVTRIVDRGDLASRSSDIGGMELYSGTSVVSSDPFRLIEAIRQHSPASPS